MKRFLLGLALMAPFGLVHAAGAAHAPTSNIKPYDTAAGKEAATPCGACHGADGNSTDPQYPRLAGQNPMYIYKQLQNFKSGARKNAIMMAQAQTLSDQDMLNIAYYFAKQPAAVSLADPEGFVAGQKLYRGGASERGVIPCAGCHGPTGAGNNAAGFPKIGGQHPEYIRSQLMAFRSAGREDEGGVKRMNDSAKAGDKGPMQMVAAHLSDEDIALLSNYVSGLHGK